MTTAPMHITGISSWFGTNRTLAEQPAKLMGKVDWLGIGFAGSMCEVPHFDARTIAVNDLHEDVIGLARVIRANRRELADALAGALVHPTELAEAQSRLLRCRESTRSGGLFLPDMNPYGVDGAIRRARDYFVVSWMSRSATMGTDSELKSGLGIRWNAGGGDTATRFNNAVASLEAWEKALHPCTFTVMDVFDFIAEAHRATVAANEAAKRKGASRDERRGLYLDPPFPGPGDAYTFRFSDEQHRRLAQAAWNLSRERVRVVCRFHDHELVRQLYPEAPGIWTWHGFAGRDMHNKGTAEVLLVAGEAA